MHLVVNFHETMKNLFTKKTLTAIASVLAVIAISVMGIKGIDATGKGSAQALWLSTGWIAVCLALAGTLVYASSQDEMPDKIKATVVMDSSIALAVGLLGITFWQHESADAWAVALLWAAACLAIGGTCGLLFGVPRSKAKTDSSGSSPIEQIADWLTKIIVGLGLTNLSKIPGKLELWAGYVAGGIGKDVNHAAALGMLLYFVVLGFVGGYLLTNLFLEGLITTFRQIAAAYQEKTG